MDQQSADRIIATVHGWEGQVRAIAPQMPSVHSGGQLLRWMVLTGDVPSATTTTDSGTGLTITVPSTAIYNANPADWNAAGNSGAGGYIIDTATTYTVVETTGLNYYSSGTWLLCRPLAGTAAATVWEPVSGRILLPFECYDDIAPGGADKYAWPLKPDLTRDTTNTPPTLKVSDSILGDVRAYGSTHSGFSVGAKGFYLSGVGGKNAIVSIQRLSKMLRAATTSAVSPSASTFTVNTVGVIDDGQDPTHGDASVTLTVNNWAGWQAASSGVPCVITPAGTNWDFLQGPCSIYIPS